MGHLISHGGTIYFRGFAGAVGSVGFLALLLSVEKSSAAAVDACVPWLDMIHVSEGSQSFGSCCSLERRLRLIGLA